MQLDGNLEDVDQIALEQTCENNNVAGGRVLAVCAHLNVFITMLYSSIFEKGFAKNVVNHPS
jgi:hypothetical protein